MMYRNQSHVQVDPKAAIHNSLEKWSEVDNMRIFQIWIRYYCQISRCRITRQSAR